MRNNLKSGFTVIELIIVMFIFAALYGVASLRLTNITQIAAVKNPLNTLVTDIRSQQIRAMVGDTAGTGGVDNYGIYFEPNQYTLFKGSVYSAGAAGNFSVRLDTNIQFNPILFPQTTVVFSKANGEVAGFVDGSNAVSIHNSTNNETKTITVNRMGSVTSVN